MSRENEFVGRGAALKRLARSTKEWIVEIWSYDSGKAGLVLLVVFVFLAFYALAVIPPNYMYIWNNPKYWQDHPILAPPQWVRDLGYQRALHKAVFFHKPSSKTFSEGFNVYVYRMSYRLDVNDYPQNLVIKISELRAAWIGERAAPVIAVLKVRRPDRVVITAYVDTITPRRGERVMFIESPYMVSMDRNRVASEIAAKVLKRPDVSLDPQLANEYLFGRVKLGPHGEVVVTPLKGVYTITLELRYPAEVRVRNPAKEVELVVVGNCFGLMGTDLVGRDLAQGLLYGFPIALLIGFVTSLASRLIGLFIGVISGYYGGVVDEVLQRVIDVMGNIPLLPFLILVVSVSPVEWRLWIIVIVLIVFGWGGLAIVIRSMTLSIKEEPYIEAARSVGASNARILLRHVIPQVIPYTIASLVFSVPSAILAEAGLSVIGLEHGWPTWGKILAAARQAQRYDVWWWIIPPGVLLALTSLTFVLLGMAMERIVEPRLRRT